MTDLSSIVTLCPTVPRASWHRPGDVWQAQDPDGELKSVDGARIPYYRRSPAPNSRKGHLPCAWSAGRIPVGSASGWTPGPVTTLDGDPSTTLRRIVDVELDESTRVQAMQPIAVPLKSGG